MSTSSITHAQAVTEFTERIQWDYTSPTHPVPSWAAAFADWALPILAMLMSFSPVWTDTGVHSADGIVTEPEWHANVQASVKSHWPDPYPADPMQARPRTWDEVTASEIYTTIQNRAVSIVHGRVLDRAFQDRKLSGRELATFDIDSEVNDGRSSVSSSA